MQQEAPAQRMSPRARLYLGIVTARHAATSLLCMFVPGAFMAPAFDGLKKSMPVDNGTTSLAVWGAIGLAVGLVSLVSVLTARDDQARIGLFLSVVMTAVWAGGFLATWLTQTDPDALYLMVLMAILTGKDLSMLQDPLRNPFEPLIREALAGRHLKG